jgi:hypothetical protein
MKLGLIRHQIRPDSIYKYIEEFKKDIYIKFYIGFKIKYHAHIKHVKYVIMIKHLTL